MAAFGCHVERKNSGDSKQPDIKDPEARGGSKHRGPGAGDNDSNESPLESSEATRRRTPLRRARIADATRWVKDRCQTLEVASQ